MSVSIKYDLVLKRSEVKRIELPNLKSNGLLLKKFTMISEQKSFDIKLVGKETIISYGEAVFYQSNIFDLNDQLALIVDSDTISMIVKNLCVGKDAGVNLSIVLDYVKTDGNIIYNNTYNNLNAEGLANIVEDIRKAGKYLTKIIFTSPNKLSSINFKPQFIADPAYLNQITVNSDRNNHVIMDLSNDEYGNFSSESRHYILSIPDNIEKLGVIVYGYIN